MKKITKSKQLEIKTVLDEETEALHLRYDARLRTQFAKALQWVKSIKSHLCQKMDQMERDEFKETLKSLSYLSLRHEARLLPDEVADTLSLLALTVLERKDLGKSLGPLPSAMQALAGVPCVPVQAFRLPMPEKPFSSKNRYWKTYEKFRAATPAKPEYITTVDALKLWRVIKKQKRLTPNLKVVEATLAGFAIMYDLALSAYKPRWKTMFAGDRI